MEPTAGELLAILENLQLEPECREEWRRYLREYCRLRYRVETPADLRKKTS